MVVGLLSSASLLLAFADAQSVKWTLETGGAIARGAPPISPDGSTLFVASDLLYAVDSSSGVQKWASKSTKSPHSPVLSADGSTLFVTTHDVDFSPSLSAVDALTGVQKWASKKNGGFGKPALSADGSTLFVGGGGWHDGGSIYASDKMLAVDALTGVRKWAFEPPNKETSIFSSPVVSADDSTVIFGSGDNLVHGVHASSGAEKWVYDIGNFTYASPALSPDGSLVCIGSGYGKFQAFDPSTGDLKWTYETSSKQERDSAGGFEIKGKPAFSPDGSTAFVGSFNDHLNAVDALTGEKKWVNGFRGATKEIHGSVPAGPGVSPDGTTVFVGSWDQNIYAINALSGATKWMFNVSGQAESDPVFSADGNTMYIGGSTKFYAFDLQGTKVQPLESQVVV